MQKKWVVKLGWIGKQKWIGKQAGMQIGMQAVRNLSNTCLRLKPAGPQIVIFRSAQKNCYFGVFNPDNRREGYLDITFCYETRQRCWAWVYWTIKHFVGIPALRECTGAISTIFSDNQLEDFKYTPWKFKYTRWDEWEEGVQREGVQFGRAIRSGSDAANPPTKYRTR